MKVSDRIRMTRDEDLSKLVSLVATTDFCVGVAAGVGGIGLAVALGETITWPMLMAFGAVALLVALVVWWGAVLRIPRMAKRTTIPGQK